MSPSSDGCTAAKDSHAWTGKWCSHPSCCPASAPASRSATPCTPTSRRFWNLRRNRVEPPCPLFTKCGGCHYQHAPYEFQLARKAEILREQLKRVGKIEYSGEIGIVSGPPLGYRNRVQVHLADGKLGYLAPRSHDLIALEGDCPVASPKLNEALAAMRERLKDAKFPRFVKSMELFTNETEVQINVLDTSRPVAKWFFEWCESAAAIDYTTSLGVFRVSPHSFFQVNRFLVEKLVEAALADLQGESALDLYAGVGLFALPLTKQFAAVTAVEAAGSAARDLAHNVSGALLVEHERVEDYLGRLKATPDLILADPPRAGLGKAVVAHLNRLAPQHLVIVSCDPAMPSPRPRRDAELLHHSPDDGRLVSANLPSGNTSSTCNATPSSLCSEPPCASIAVDAFRLCRFELFSDSRLA